MSDTYGSGLTSFGAPDMAGGPSQPVDSGPQNGPGAPLDISPPGIGGAGPGPQPTNAGPAASEPERPSFGQSLREGFGKMLPGPHYTAPDPQASALDQTADLLQQRVKRANSIATNPIAQFFAPDRVAAARAFVPQATEQLQKIEQQKSAIQAGRVQARTLGLDPAEVSDQATQEDRLTIASGKALKGDMRAFQGIQAVDPTRAAAIAPQVYETVAKHLDKAQLAFDSLASMQDEGQYQAKVKQLRQDGTLTDLESLGMKLPPTFEAFGASKAMEGRALREARIGINTIGQQLEARNTYQPMETKEADTYKGRLTTAYGDQITNGTWGRNGASGTRGLIVNGAADPHDLGKKFTLATPEQRKEIREEFAAAVPKEDLEKYRAFNRTYELATKDAKGNPVGDRKINTNPNVQQGIAEGLASMLRGGSGGANVGLLKIELMKRGWAQTAIDGLVSNYAGTMNTLFKNADRPYLSQETQKQIRDVMDVLKTYNDSNINDRTSQIAQRAGALGLDPASLGFGKTEATGAIGQAMEDGRREQIARMLQAHQAIGGGDGVLQLNAQRPGAGAAPLPGGAQPANELPGAQPLQTPVQQAQQPAPQQPQPGAPPPAPAPQQPAPAPAAPVPQPGGGGSPAPAPQQPAPAPQQPGAGAPPAAPGGAGPSPAPAAPQPGAPQPVTIAGQQVSLALPAGVSPGYVTKMQRIESGKSPDPWKAEVRAKKADGKTPISSASGAFQMLDGTWQANKPAGAPDRAKDATPAQQAQALANLAAKDAATLQSKGVPVTDTSLYIAHNLGATGGTRLMTADPSADAREIVGERAAKNNPLFFKGRPTVATVLQRYADAMNSEDGKPPVRLASANATTANDGSEPGAPRTAAEAAAARTQRSVLRREAAPADTSTERRPGQWGEAGNAAIEHAPAIGSTAGAVGGFFTPVPGGTAIGGAAGGAAGQALKDYLKGNDQNPREIIKQGVLGGVLGVASPAGRPVVGAVVRAVGAGGVEAADAAAKGENGADIVDAGIKGTAAGVVGETFGRALGMAGHKVWSLFGPDAKQTIRTAAKEFSEAEATLRTEAPKIPGANGGAATANPKYDAAEAVKAKAEKTLKDAGLNPEEAAYAHNVSTRDNGNIPVPRQEAEAARPGAIEQKNVGEGYRQLETEVGDKGVGAVKSTPKLPDGPIAVAADRKMSPSMRNTAERTEMSITAPAKDWQEKWVQLKDARSALLELERDAASSTTAGRTQQEKDYRTLADAVRAQQEKAAKYVFGEKEGAAFVQRLNVLDARYRRLMEATNGMDLASAAKLKGEAGREAQKRFEAFAHDDPVALAAFRAMRGAKGDAYESTVPWTVAGEGLPVVGKVIKTAKLAGMLSEWARERTAASPVKFTDLVKMPNNAAQWQSVRDILGGAGARAAESLTQ